MPTSPSLEWASYMSPARVFTFSHSVSIVREYHRVHAAPSRVVALMLEMQDVSNPTSE